MKSPKLYFIFFIILLTLGWGTIKLYYELTAGFTVATISSDLSYNPQWESNPLSQEQKKEVNSALSQSYSYLAKGCQSYVFISEDDKFVIKFFKFQHFRPKYWVTLFDFIPWVNEYQQKKMAEKRELLETTFESIKIASNSLKNETGIVYLHLNKSNDLKESLILKDKLGWNHTLDIDNFEFVIQHRAESIEKSINQMIEKKDQDKAKLLIDRLLIMLLSEYSRGFADNDHALMQNTGVLNGYPVHIDIGQFIYNPIVQTPEVYKKELFDKTFFLHQWLQKKYPDLADHLENRLLAVIGPDYFSYPPFQHREGGVGKIPSQKNKKS